MTDLTQLETKIKELIVKTLKLEDVKPDDIESRQPLFSDGLGLDSIDALELSVALSKKFGFELDGKTTDYKKHFASVHSLALLVASKRKGTAS